MISVDLIAVLATVAFVGSSSGRRCSPGRGLGLEQRAGLLERRDPGTAAALRRAQSISDFASGGVFGDEGFGAVCTPSRRSGHRHGAGARHRLRPARRGRPRRRCRRCRRPSSRSLAASTSAGAAPAASVDCRAQRLGRRRRARATSRPRAGSRRTTRCRGSSAR